MIVLLVVAVVSAGVGAFALMNRGGDPSKDEKLIPAFDNPMLAEGDEEDDGEN